jgi:hypothetical protein
MWLFGEREKQCVQMKIAPKISSGPVGEKSMEALYYGIVSGLYPYPPAAAPLACSYTFAL